MWGFLLCAIYAKYAQNNLILNVKLCHRLRIINYIKWREKIWES